MSESESAKVEEVSSTSTVVLDQAFNSGAVSSVSDKLAWNHAPKSAEVVESGLRLHPVRSSALQRNEKCLELL